LFWNCHTVALMVQWGSVSKRGTHLADSFFPIVYKIEITVPCDTPVVSTSSRTFTRQSVKTISDFIDDFWRSNLNWTSRTRCITYGCTTTFKFIHSIVYNCIANTGADVLWTLFNSVLISFGVKPFIGVWSRNSFFFAKNTKVVRLIVYRNKITRWIPLKIWVISWEILLVKK